MKYSEFEDIISQQRMRKYLLACNNDSKKAMTLYRYNLKLSQEMFTLISCFEVALRNKIDKQLTANLGNDWLRDAVIPNGRLYVFQRCLCSHGTIVAAHFPQQADLYSTASI